MLQGTLRKTIWSVEILKNEISCFVSLRPDVYNVYTGTPFYPTENVTKK